jgi:hypothetical protein
MLQLKVKAMSLMDKVELESFRKNINIQSLYDSFKENENSESDSNMGLRIIYMFRI